MGVLIYAYLIDVDYIVIDANHDYWGLFSDFFVVEFCLLLNTSNASMMSSEGMLSSEGILMKACSRMQV